MLRDLIDDAAVGIAITIRVLERLRHRLHDRIRRSVRILVVGELGERVVLVSGSLLCLGQEAEWWPEAQEPHCGGDAADKAATAYSIPVEHGCLHGGDSNP